MACQLLDKFQIPWHHLQIVLSQSLEGPMVEKNGVLERHKDLEGIGNKFHTLKQGIRRRS